MAIVANSQLEFNEVIGLARHPTELVALLDSKKPQDLMRLLPLLASTGQ